MSVFSYLPRIDYDFDGQTQNVPDITRGFKVKDEILNNSELYVIYTIRDGETPEMLAARVYESADLAWIIMMMNGIHNIYTEWPMSYETLNRYVDEKYGPGNRNKIHHYTDLRGVVVSEDHPQENRIPVTNYDHESILNDQKRKIKVLKQQYVQNFRNAIWELFR